MDKQQKEKVLNELTSIEETLTDFLLEHTVSGFEEVPVIDETRHKILKLQEIIRET